MNPTGDNFNSPDAEPTVLHALKPFSWAHGGHTISEYAKGDIISTHDEQLVSVATKEKWAKVESKDSKGKEKSTPNKTDPVQPDGTYWENDLTLEAIAVIPAARVNESAPDVQPGTVFECIGAVAQELVREGLAKIHVPSGTEPNNP